MAIEDILGGVGKSRVQILRPANNDVPGDTIFDYTFPLCQLDGYSEIWTEERFFKRFINLDLQNPKVKEVKFYTNAWGEWILNWEDIPMLVADAKKVIDTINNQGRAGNGNDIYLYPKYDTFPDRKFLVNLISPGIAVNNSDNESDWGNFGFKLEFRTVETQLISIPAPTAPDITPRGGTSGPVFHGPIQT